MSCVLIYWSASCLSLQACIHTANLGLQLCKDVILLSALQSKATAVLIFYNLTAELIVRNYIARLGYTTSVEWLELAILVKRHK